MTWWKWWEKPTGQNVDLEEVDREIEEAKILAKVKDIDADVVKVKLYRHRTENHFSELVAHVLRGDDDR